MKVRPELEKLEVEIDSVSPHPKNARRGDISKLMESLQLHGQYRPIVIHQETNEILAGNHTWQAAKKLGWESIAVTYVDCNEEQALRILLADNRYSDLAGYDESALLEVLGELAETETELIGTGYSEQDVLELLSSQEEEDEENYVRNLKPPVYEPTSEQPEVEQLFDDTHTKVLMEEIEAVTDLPEEVRAFLAHAARRHTVFNFDLIAEFYAHASPSEQRLFERSGLVIIDFEDAIANGFVKLDKRMASIFSEERSQDNGNIDE